MRRPALGGTANPADVDERRERGYERFLDHVGEERVRAYLDGTDA